MQLRDEVGVLGRHVAAHTIEVEAVAGGGRAAQVVRRSYRPWCTVRPQSTRDVLASMGTHAVKRQPSAVRIE